MRLISDFVVSVTESTTGVSGGVAEVGDTIEITASGEIWAGVWFTGKNGPAGWDWVDNDPELPLPGTHPYSLIARVAERPWTFIGNGRTFATDAAGEVILRTNDKKPGNGSDGFWATVRIWRPDAGDVPDCNSNPAPNMACLAARDRAMRNRDEVVAACQQLRSAREQERTMYALAVVAWIAFLAALLVVIAIAVSYASASEAARLVAQAAASRNVAIAAPLIWTSLAAAAVGPLTFALVVAVAIAVVLATVATIASIALANAMAALANARTRMESLTVAFMSALGEVRRFCCAPPPMLDMTVPACE